MNLVPAANLMPPKDKRTGRPNSADRRELEKEKDPGSAFGPESVPLATGSISVVYWVPGPFPRPTPCPAGSAPQAPSALLLCHVGCWTEQQHTPDRGDVNHEPWRRRYRGEGFGYITSQLGEMFAARPGRRESTAGLLGPPAVICRFCPVGAADFYRVTEKFGPLPTCIPWFRGMDHPTWRHVILTPLFPAADAATPSGGDANG